MTPDFWIKAAQLVLALAILIVLHEGGHFLAAKMFGIRVEKFFLFFDYKRHLISTKDKWVQRLFPRVKNWETEYGIGWIPLGGYVKIAGMIDESMDKEQMAQPVQPWEFRAKRPWQRLIVMLGGVFVNFIFAVFLYICILWVWGDSVYPMDKNFSQGFYFNKAAQEMGFRNGDRLLAIGGDTIANYMSLKHVLQMDGAESVTVLRCNEHSGELCNCRDRQPVDIAIPEDFPVLAYLKQNPPFFAPIVESCVDSVAKGSVAEAIGIRANARLLGVSTIDSLSLTGEQLPAEEGVAPQTLSISTWNEFEEIMLRRFNKLAVDCSHEDSLRLRTITLAFMNEGDTALTVKTTQLDEHYMLGIFKHPWRSDAVIDSLHYNFWQAVPAGINLGCTTMADYVAQLKYLFSREGAESVGSFATIGNLFPASWDWYVFWGMTAFLSVILAFMNVLPIPGLDGGHAIFTLIEMLTGHSFSEKFQERALKIGFTLILALMALAIFNDIRHFVF